MNAANALHPSAQALRAFGLGILDGAAAADVKSHLEQCAACRRLVAEASSGSSAGRPRDANSRAGPPSPPDATASAASRGQEFAPQPSGDQGLPPELASLSQYEVVRELGRGGMGVVYLARNIEMDRLEVLKTLNQELLARRGAALERFLREIRTAARLSHPNIVIAYSTFEAGRLRVLAMEYVDGQNLADLVQARGPLPVPLACHFMYQAALGLQHAHEAGMIHRDIKPGNLMVARSGRKAVVKVLDFGLAKALREGPIDSARTHEGQALGTPDYNAPEQIINARAVDIRADIYSLGCTLYYVLTGHAPFHGSSLYDIYQAHISTDAKPLNLIRPEVPAELAAVVARMMAKEPAQRYQTPGEVATALKPFWVPGASVPPAQPVTAVSVADAPAAAPQEAVRPREQRWDSLIDLSERSASSSGERAVAPLSVPSEGTGERKRLLVAAGAAALLFAVLAVVLLVRTKNGELKLEGLPDNAVVTVDGAEVRVEWPDGPRQGVARIHVPVGTHEVQVAVNGVLVDGKKVTITTASHETFTVERGSSHKATEATAAAEAEPAEIVSGPNPAADASKDSGPSPPPLTGDRTPVDNRRVWVSDDGNRFVNDSEKHWTESAANQVALSSWSEVERNEIFIEVVNRSQDLHARLYDDHFDVQSGKDLAWRVFRRGSWDRTAGSGDRTPADNRRIWLAEHGGRWVNDSGTHWIEKPRDKDYVFEWDEVERKENYIEFFDRRRGYRARLFDDRFDIKRPQEADWSTLCRGSWDRTDPPAAASASRAASPAASGPRVDDGFTPLFDGKDFDGWTARSSNKDAEPAQIFGMEGRDLVWTGMQGRIASKQTFGDFVLKFTYQVGNARFHGGIASFGLQFSEAEIYTLKSSPESVPDVYAFLNSGTIWSTNIPFSAGDLRTDNANREKIRAHLISCAANVARPVGEWNEAEIQCVGRTVRVTLNGREVNCAEFNQPLRCRLVFHSFGTDLRIRDARLARLRKHGAVGATPNGSESELGDSFQSLFNGKDLTGWKAHPAQANGWRVQDGVLIGPANAPGVLYTERTDFTDFHLVAEVRVNEPGEGGVFFRTTVDPARPVDDPKCLVGFDAVIQRRVSVQAVPDTGSLHVGDEALVVVANGWASYKPHAGGWFTLDVIAQGEAITVMVDGHMTAYKLEAERLASSGRIALLQKHARTSLAFRSIKVRELRPVEPPSPREIRRMQPERGSQVSRVAWSPDGRKCISDRCRTVGFHRDNGGSGGFYSYTETLRIWDADTGRNLATLSKAGSLLSQSTVFAPNGRLVASTQGWEGKPSNAQYVLVFDVNAGKQLHQFVRKESPRPVLIVGAGFSADNSRALAVYSDGVVQQWDLSLGSELPAITLQGRAWRPHEFTRALFTADGRRLLTGRREGQLELWDLPSGERARVFLGHEGPLRDLACSADGKRVLSGGSDNTVRLWDVATGKLVGTAKGNEYDLRCVALSPDGRYALSAGNDPAVRLWDLSTGKEICRLEGHTMGVNSVAFSPDGSRAASGSDDGTIRLWRLPTDGPASNAAANVASPGAPKEGGTAGFTLKTSPPPATTDDRFVSLFNGKDLAGWIVDSGLSRCWRVEKGDLVTSGPSDSRRQGWLLSDRNYTEFVLRFEFQMGPDANSGVTFWSEPGEFAGRAPNPIQVELRDHDLLKHRTGSFYWSESLRAEDAVPPDRAASLKPAGEWNHAEIEVRKNALRVAINEREVLKADLARLGSAPDAQIAFVRQKGRVGFESRSGTARFRNIAIRDLTNP